MFAMLDAGVFNLMAQRIKVDFALSDEELGFLIGPADLFYVLVGIPMARLVDIYPRKIVLACGIAVIGGITALGGLAQNFKQLFCSRMLVGAGGSAHAPGAYSMLADYFPPAKLPRAIGILQLGFIGGSALGIFFGGQLIGMASSWPVSHWHGLTIRGWQWVLIMVGAPGLIVAAMIRALPEPARRGKISQERMLPLRVIVRRYGGAKGSMRHCSSASRSARSKPAASPNGARRSAAQLRLDAAADRHVFRHPELPHLAARACCSAPG